MLDADDAAHEALAAWHRVFEERPRIVLGAAAPRPWPRGARVCDATEAVILLQGDWRVVGRSSCASGCHRDTLCAAHGAPPVFYVVAPAAGPFARALRDVVDLAARVLGWRHRSPSLPGGVG